MRRRWLPPGLLVALAAAVPLGSAARAYLYERDTFQRGPPPVRPADLALEDVRLALPSGEVRGWYLPSHNRAAVVLVHGTESDRTGLLAEARLLSAGGYGALLLDLPGSGESEGRETWGEPEVAAVRAGADWLAARPEVDPERLGVLGFSLGSAVAVLAAASEPRLQALALVGAFPDYEGQLRAEFSRWGWLTGRAAVLGAEAGGARPAELRPVEVVPHLAGRPLLFVAGAADRTVPPALTRALFQAAPEPKTLREIPGAGHGDCARVAPRDYGQTLLGFFDRALAPRRR